MPTKHTIIYGDSRKMSLIQDESVQLIVTSPPYWQLKDYGIDAQIGFNDSYEEYVNNLNLVWSECFRVLEPGCRLCINIGDQFARSVYYGRYKVIPIHSEIIRFCEERGFDYMGSIIWQKTTSMHTTGGDKVMGSFPYPRGGIVKIDFEYILIFKKFGNAKATSKETREKSKLTKEEWDECFSSHWIFEGARQDKHIAVFPEELPKRLIKMFSFVGDTVLDPFMGSGTTALAAKNLCRNSIGYEINSDFYNFYKEKVIYTDHEINSYFEKIEDTSILDLQTLQNALPYRFVDIHKLNKLVDVKQNTFGSKFETSKSDLFAEDKVTHSGSTLWNKKNDEPMVLINHARSDLRKLMIEKGICYLRAGNSKGSVLVQPGFERLQYLLLHTAGNNPLLFRLKTKGMFQIWTKETLIENGFNPQSSPYYIVLHFDNHHPIQTTKMPQLKENKNTYKTKIKELHEFL
ncbi:DNA-methyltransferase [Parabacteroides sp.]